MQPKKDPRRARTRLIKGHMQRIEWNYKKNNFLFITWFRHTTQDLRKEL